MLQRKFLHIGLKDLTDRITIRIPSYGQTRAHTCFAYVEPLLENKNFTKSRVVIVFPENKFLFSSAYTVVHLEWKSKEYITFDVHKLKPHLLICVAFESICSTVTCPVQTNTAPVSV